MYYAKESFNVNSHTLSILLNELKDNGFKSDVFDEPIAYIESLERINDSHSNGDFYFRYLIGKDMICQESLKIPMFEYSKIKTYITNIERFSNTL